MLTIRQCREKSGLSCKTMSYLLDVDEEKYRRYEDYVEPMPTSICTVFSRIVEKPVKKNIFIKS